MRARDRDSLAPYTHVQHVEAKSQRKEVEVHVEVEVVIYKFTEQTLHMVEQSILGEALAF